MLTASSPKMDDEFITLHNVMPVELAIKRELEYRRKMEVLKKQHQSDLKPLVILQGPTPSHGGTKRKFPDIDARQHIPTLKSFSSCQFVCVFCRVAFATVFHLKQPGETPGHKGKLLEMKGRGQNVSNPFLCELCNAPCSSINTMDGHLNGIKHAGSLQEFENVKRARAQGTSAANLQMSSQVPFFG